METGKIRYRRFHAQHEVNVLLLSVSQDEFYLEILLAK